MKIDLLHTTTIIKELPTEGHSPLLVVGSDYNMYVAKNDKGKIPAYSLINEFIASFCLQHWKIESPNAKLVKVNKELILGEKNLSNNHKPHYYDIFCFGSQWVKNSIDVNDFLHTSKKKGFNKIINPRDVFHITLFDTWIENDDRKR